MAAALLAAEVIVGGRGCLLVTCGNVGDGAIIIADDREKSQVNICGRPICTVVSNLRFPATSITTSRRGLISGDPDTFRFAVNRYR